MEIDHRGLQAAVSHVLLDDSQADSGFEQMCGVGMPQRMRTDLLAKVDLSCDQLHRANGGGTHRSLGVRASIVTASLGGEQEAVVAVCHPIPAGAGPGWMLQGDVSIFGSLATVDVDHASLCVDITDLKVESFLHPQAE